MVFPNLFQDFLLHFFRVFLFLFLFLLVGPANFRKAFSKTFVRLLISGVGPSSRVVGSRCNYLSVFGI